MASCKVLTALFLVCSFLLSSCKKEKDIESFIERFDTTDFSEFKNMSITYRGSAGVHDTYVVSKFGEKHGNYFVSYDRALRNVKHIDSSHVKKDAAFIGAHEINEKMKRFKSFDFYILAVDQEGNVYINPYHADDPVFFLKVRKPTNQKIIRKGYTYEHFKKNWYINTYYSD